MTEAPKIYLLDTSVLLHRPESIFSFGKNNVVIPIVVLDELDTFKRGSMQINRNARRIISMFDELRSRGPIFSGVKLDGGGNLKVDTVDERCIKQTLPSGFEKNADNHILATAVGIKNENPDTKVVLVTKDINMRVKAEALGLQAEDYKADQIVDPAEMYTGQAEVRVSQKLIDQFYKDKTLPVDGLLSEEGGINFYPNQFLMLICKESPSVTALAKYDGNNLELLRDPRHDIWGIRPLNREQRYAVEVLLDDNISLVTLAGKAGTGKTILAIAAGLSIKVPELFGIALSENGEGFYTRNLGLFVLPFLSGYFAWKRKLRIAYILWIGLSFAVATVFANVYPFAPGSDTEVLTALHLPIALWLLVGIAYVGGQWRSGSRRMDFVRFSGELFIYYVLIALGGGVFTILTGGMFWVIGLDLDWFLVTWLLPCGALGAVLIGAWLVEAKQGVLENMAPVLARIFTPLFTALLPSFLAAMIWKRSGMDFEREVLIGFDLMLILILGLLLYNVSARDSKSKPNIFDALQFVLLLSAVVIDVLVLAAIAGRIFEFGLSANKVAALGENLILFANLSVSALLYFIFLIRRGSFTPIERWQTAYIPVYAAWAVAVVVGFPPMFSYL